ncbi:hypothetical protein TIFTF001_031790 [Ficus carica]|uniref:Uncharacterized protein n=1 Tax=Ficus carica TaxID=3494 RepID=A0AA88J5W8_FICCA|nr:hypothetical protein TIFTF001_031790 [Ficus carica]
MAGYNPRERDREREREREGGREGGSRGEATGSHGEVAGCCGVTTSNSPALKLSVWTKPERLQVELSLGLSSIPYMQALSFSPSRHFPLFCIQGLG